jgi:hypothetical protein
MSRGLSLGILGWLVWAAVSLGAEEQQAKQSDAPPAVAPAQPAGDAKNEETKLLSAVKDALERNAQEIKALKEQYARDMEEQRKKVQEQQKQIQALQAQINKQAPPEGAKLSDAERQKKLTELQQKQLEVIEEQSQLVADQVKKQAPMVEGLQRKTATLESRATQAAARDQQLADAYDDLRDSVDASQRNPQWMPAPLREWFLPSGTNVTPASMWSTVTGNYHVFTSRKGAGHFEFEEYTPFFLVQLNKRFLMSAEVSFTPGGVSLGQAQIDAFINDWLTADAGYFLAPTGFLSERLDPTWIIKTPDLPLSALQVMPDGLTLMGLQLRGARYLFGSPVKMEYSAWMTNGLGVPGMGKAADWYDLTAVVGTASSVNDAMAYGARLAFWLPARGINFGVSEFVNSPYTKMSGAEMSIWQPYFNYHRGNWDFRFEYGNTYEITKPFIGNNIRREGLYAQIAYRDYQSLNKHLQRLEYLFRYSDAFFHGIDQKSFIASPLDPPQSSPVNANQYTVGINYYFYPSMVLKLAYEWNQELHTSLHANEFLMQFATNF